MKISVRVVGCLIVTLVSLSGCVSQTVKTTKIPAIQTPTAAIPNEQLLDVSIALFDPGLDIESDGDIPVFPEVRQSEARYMPQLLMNAMQDSGAWGAGDIDKAIEILRVKGISKASKKMSRDAKEGVVAVTGDETKTSVIEVNCETDFVAKNEDFTNFVKELSELNNEKNSNLDDLKISKMKNGGTVEDNVVSLIAKIGEKITIGKAKTIENAGTVNNHHLHTVVKDNISNIPLV